MSNDDHTVSAEVRVQNKYGIHARPSALLVKMASRFSSEITFADKFGSTDGKSLMDLLALEFDQGKIIRITAKGPDAREAVAALIDVINNIPKDT